MVYSLIEGLTALGAYGIIMIANNSLYDFTRNIFLSENEKTDVLTVFVYFLPVLGIAYLAGFLGYIIINSEVVIVENLKLYVSLALVLTIAITHFKLFWDINSSFIREKEINKRFTPFVCAFWAGVFSYFMTSPDVIRATIMLSIQFLPLISKYIIPRFSGFQKR